MQPWQTSLGVDLGTSHTVAVLAPPDGREQPLLFDSSPLLPSAVFGAAERRLLVGRDALREGRLAPERLEQHPKRRVDDGAILLGTDEFPIVDVFAALLRRVAEEAARAAGTPSRVVLTHPATWAAPRRQILTEAAAAAGFGSVTLVPEPVAAAVYFTTVLRRDVPPGGALVVFDLGAGTFDTSVVARRPDGSGWEVLSADGDDTVGGVDLDEAVVNWVGRPLAARDPGLWSRLVTSPATEDRRRRQQLYDEARVAKEQLSRQSTATVRVPLFDVDVHVTREEFEQLARPLLERAVVLTAATLVGSGRRPDQIAGLFLVGGSSRIPLVATLLHQRLGLAPTLIEQPELVVAYGSLQTLSPPPPAPAASAASAASGGFAGSPGLAVPPASAPVSAPASPSGGWPSAPSGAPVAWPSGAPLSSPSGGWQTSPSGAPVSPPPGARPGSPSFAPSSPASGGPPGGPFGGARAAAPAPPPAGRRREPGRRRTLQRVVAAVLAVVVVAVAGYVIQRQATAGDRNRTPGSTNGTTGQPAGAVGKPGAAQSITISRVVWYAAAKFTFGAVTYQPPAEGAADGTLTADVKVENLSGKPLNRNVYATYTSGAGQHSKGQLAVAGQVPGKETSPARFKFDVGPGEVGDLKAGKITIGESNEAMAVVPLGDGAPVTLEPRRLLDNVSKTAGQLQFDRLTCTLRADILDGEINDAHTQIKDGYRYVACQFDVRPLGNVGYSGQDLGKPNFRLRQPDNTALAPSGAAARVLGQDELQRDLWFWFEVPTPLDSSVYLLQLLYLGRSNKDAATPANTVAIELLLT